MRAINAPMHSSRGWPSCTTWQTACGCCCGGRASGTSTELSSNTSLLISLDTLSDVTGCRGSLTAAQDAFVRFFLFRSVFDSGRDKRQSLVGLVTAVEYGDALYCFNFSVVPGLRGRGLGRRLQHECQRVALTCGHNKVSGTVDTSSPRLVSYYLALGGLLVPTGACRWPLLDLLYNMQQGYGVNHLCAQA